MKTIKNVNLKNKSVLLRIDVNSDVKGKKVILSERIKPAAEMINYLLKKKAKVTILAHQGNPGKKDFTSLAQHAKHLNKFTRVKFVKDTIGKKAIEEIKKVKPGKAILLENIRFIDDEFNPNKKDNKLIRKLAQHFEIFINDAFSVCHRKQTSITEFPKYLESYPGICVEKELKALEKISMNGTLYVLGGGKPESNYKLVGKNKVLACGFFGQMCLISKGKDLGYQNNYLKKAALVKSNYNSFLKKLKNNQKKVQTPIDFAVNVRGKRVEHELNEFPINYQIDDIGEETIKLFVKEIKKARSIYMKGPAGFSQNPKFSKGTVEILKAIAKSRAFSLIGGGHLSDSIAKYKLPKKKFNHISLSGGALLNYVAGEQLPGLKALGYYEKD